MPSFRQLQGSLEPHVHSLYIPRPQLPSQAAESHHKEIGEIFARALAAFRNRSWTDAIRLFNRILEYRAADGPAEFYLRLCERYRGTPPEAGWDGSVCMDRK